MPQGPALTREAVIAQELAATSFSNRWVRVNGYMTRYIEAGEGEPVLLVHGGGPGASSDLAWREVMPALSEHFRVIALDNLGFGLSEIPPLHLASVRRLARHLRDFIDTLNLGPVRVMGNSIGATVAMKFALDDFDRVHSVVNIASNSLARCLGVEFDKETAKPALRTDEAEDRPWDAEGVRRFMEAIRFRRERVTDDLVERRVSMANLPGATAWSNAVAGNAVSLFEDPNEAQAMDMTTRYPLFKRPVRWCWGLEDHFSPVSVAEQLVERYPGIDMHWIPAASHQVQGDNAEDLNRVVLEFFLER